VAMTHHVFHVSGAAEKSQLVHRLASGTGRRILFMRTKHQARKLAKQLTDAGVPSVDLHGNLSQPARDRNLAAFSSGDARVLVATDIAARGVHVDDVELVVHVDPPVEHKAYLHRSGRTARAGSAGDVVTVVLPEQRRDTQQLLRKAGISALPQQVRADSASVLELVGEIAPHREPPPRQAPPARTGGGSSRGGSGRGGSGSHRGGPSSGGRPAGSGGNARRGGGGPRRPRSGSGRAQASS
jgi:superfamily II DNA/RNA helicase